MSAARQTGELRAPRSITAFTSCTFAIRAATGKRGTDVGMTGLTPEQRFANHKAGTKAARVVKRFGVRLVPKLYAHLNPMTYLDALAMEKQLAAELRARGFQVFGGT